MIYVLHIFEDDRLVATTQLGDPAITNDQTTFRVPRYKFDDTSNPPPRRRRRTRPAREAMERFFDPNRERPILKNLLSTVAPIAISFLTQQLPQWLGDIDLQGPPDQP